MELLFENDEKSYVNGMVLRKAERNGFHKSRKQINRIVCSNYYFFYNTRVSYTIKIFQNS